MDARNKATPTSTWQGRGRTINYPKLEVRRAGCYPDDWGADPRGAILKIVATNISARTSTWSAGARPRLLG